MLSSLTSLRCRCFPGPAAPDPRTPVGRRFASPAVTTHIRHVHRVDQADLDRHSRPVDWEPSRLTWNDAGGRLRRRHRGGSPASRSRCRLLEVGRSVIVVDRAGVGEGETLRTGGHVASALDDRYTELERLHGEGRRADGGREPPVGDQADGGQGREVRHRLRLPARGRLSLPRAGIRRTHSRRGVRRGAARGPRRGALLGRRTWRGALRTRPCGSPTRPVSTYAIICSGLAAPVRRRGRPRFRRGRRVIWMEDGAAAARVRTRDGIEVRAGAIVVATNVPFHRRIAFHTEQAASMAHSSLPAAFPAGRLRSALYWDTGAALRFPPLPGRRRERRLALPDRRRRGLQDRPGRSEAHCPFDALTAWARTVRARRSAKSSSHGRDRSLEPVDGLAFIGADPGAKRVFVVTGDSGNGLTHGTLAGPLLPALMHGEDHPWRRVLRIQAARGSTGHRSRKTRTSASGTATGCRQATSRSVGPHSRGRRRGGVGTGSTASRFTARSTTWSTPFWPVAAPRLRSAMERDREELELTVPRLAVRGARRPRAQRARAGKSRRADVPPPDREPNEA